MSVLDRFFDKVQMEPNSGCWLWSGYINKGGYGRFNVDGNIRNAHRFYYEYLNGPVGRLDLDHLCRNRCCVNPDHLEPVTRSVNCKRGLTGHHTAALERAKTHCPMGHEYSPDNTIYSAKGSRLCRECKRAWHARWVSRNREHVRAYARGFYWKQKENSIVIPR